MEEMGLDEESKAAASPAVKEDANEDEVSNEEDALRDAAKTRFRAVAARLNYVGADRMDVQFGVKEVCRKMAKPTNAAWQRAKRAVRYMVGAARVVWLMRWSDEGGDTVDIFCDSDWAGCRATRRSTSGGILVVGGTAIKTWSTTQRTIALSSGEAEYASMVKAGAEGLGIVAVAKDLGWEMKTRLWTDSSAAKSVAARRGLGRLRHVEVHQLWLQETVKNGRISVKKVHGKSNPSDALTKPLSFRELAECLRKVGGEIRQVLGKVNEGKCHGRKATTS